MFIVDKKPKSIAAEAYRTLRTNIQYSSFDKEYKTIVVTSSEPGEGKSTTSGNLALAISQGESKVLLIDCDLRKPSLHKLFRISNNYGLSDLLLHRKTMEDVAVKYNEGLTVVPAGKIPPNPSEMLGSKAMGTFLDEMKKHFDYIIMDTPPIGAVTDSQVLSTKVDGTILVVKAGQTKKDVVMNSVNAIKKVNGNIIGTVLNGVENSKNKYYYYYGN
ncbi:CpsD/CapB family tyrosine-protein kinase [Clostridium sp. NSJ-145]|uniref:CpsD/CapB family tyrosine-protein kinase n=1 Tax=Clostridium sp. NSJ-145 TaxID=2897777 RepID=UPI001E30DF46|nr:CpsD/CapB family tyrosine-protein kinase [Clostridium sp. NSJ-145]MCD2502301.1 CpsD/CapB family tyrosine-protein kinase [Clostridium sp. NSJ-145]